MKQSQLFTKTHKEAPKDETTINAQLLTRAGFVDKLMAGNYTYLPLGIRVLNKVRNIVREEINAIGGQEIIMPTLHPSENWKITKGWDTIDVLFKIKSRTGKDYALGQSEYEIIASLAKEIIKKRIAKSTLRTTMEGFAQYIINPFNTQLFIIVSAST